MKSLLVLSIAAVLGATVAIAVARPPGGGNHPNLFHAEMAVEHAKDSLSKSTDSGNLEFNVHRMKAMELLDAAQKEIEAAKNTQGIKF